MKTPLNRYTFKSKKLRMWVENHVEGRVLNLFAGKTKLNCDEVRNDLDPLMPAEYHKDALEFCKFWSGPKFDTVLVDPPYCYDEATEILTENGWKYFYDLKQEEKVATLNSSSGMLEYQLPTDYISQTYNGRMVKIKSGSIDLLVTLNHNLYVRKLWKTNNFKFVKAEDLDFGCNFKCNCDWDGIEQEYFTLPFVSFEKHNRYGDMCAKSKKIKMDDWLCFLGIYLADGSVDPKGTNYRVRIAKVITEDRLVIEEWVSKIGFHYIVEKNAFTILNKQLCTYLRRFGKAPFKFIPKEIKQLSKRQLQILFDSMMFCDGHRSENPRWNEKYKKYYIDKHTSYSSVSKQLIDDVSEIGLKLGYVPILHIIYKGKYNPVYSLSFTKYRITPMLAKKKFGNYISVQDYCGNIYCVSVPNRLIYVRRNGKPTWCGNSYRKSMEMYSGKKQSPFNATKDAVVGILNPNGIVMTFGYQSNVMGAVRGFKQEHLLVISHSGAIHDTLCIIERHYIDKGVLKSKWATTLMGA